MTKEEFRNVPGFSGYRVSDQGKLISCRSIKGQGRARPTISVELDEWHEITPHRTGRKGHMQVNLRRDGKPKAVSLHRLVLEVFVGPCPEGMECRHLNGNATDNRLANLCWGTRSENRKDAIRHGTMPQMGPGEQHIGAKLTNKNVIMIKKLLEAGKLTGREIAKRFGVSGQTVCDIKTKRRWGHVTSI